MNGYFDQFKDVNQLHEQKPPHGTGLPVNLHGTFQDFINGIKDSNHYIGLDTNFLVHYNLFREQFKSIRFVISQHTINVFEDSLQHNDENAQIASTALKEIEQAVQEGYQISVATIAEEEMDQLGLEQTFTATVMASFYKAKLDIEQTHHDWRTIYIMTLSEEGYSIEMADKLQLATFIVTREK